MQIQICWTIYNKVHLCYVNFRAAASRCRQKKKNLIVNLENKIAELQKVNGALEVNIVSYS